MMYLVLNFRRKVKNNENPLWNNRNPKSQRDTNAAEVKNLYSRINVEDELFLIFLIVIII